MKEQTPLPLNYGVDSRRRRVPWKELHGLLVLFVLSFCVMLHGEAPFYNWDISWWHVLEFRVGTILLVVAWIVWAIMIIWRTRPLVWAILLLLVGIPLGVLSSIELLDIRDSFEYGQEIIREWDRLSEQSQQQKGQGNPGE